MADFYAWVARSRSSWFQQCQGWTLPHVFPLLWWLSRLSIVICYLARCQKILIKRIHNNTKIWRYPGCQCVRKGQHYNLTMTFSIKINNGASTDFAFSLRHFLSIPFIVCWVHLVKCYFITNQTTHDVQWHLAMLRHINGRDVILMMCDVTIMT